jgi:hypothetical protein
MALIIIQGLWARELRPADGRQEDLRLDDKGMSESRGEI